MFGLDFLFGYALWALPVAGLPVLLHMLFRRKSPLVFFPTLRFVKASIQQTAARRRIQRWILLACRILLLLLLIWAISQPVRILASGWFTGTQSVVAAIVADTSYSMLLRPQQVTLLEQEDAAISDLLREPLKDAKVAIFRSLAPPADSPETLQTSTAVQSQWSALKPQPGQPLANRCAAAMRFLERQQATQKWLVILSDLQSREFPAPLPEVREARVVLFDLHPDEARSAGITRVSLEPEQPIPGIGCQVAVQVAGRAGDARASSISIARPDGASLKQVGPLMAIFDGTGRSIVRAPLPQGLPAERWLLVSAQLQADDALSWDNTRSTLVELPPRQAVSLLDMSAPPQAAQFIRMALDPWEGKLATWPLDVQPAKQLTGRENVTVVPMGQWPDQLTSRRLVQFARSGGTLILLLQPGLEQSWAGLADAQKGDLLELLPAQPIAATDATGLFRPVPPTNVDRVLSGLTDPSFRLNQLIVRRFVAFDAPGGRDVSTLLHLSPLAGDSRPSSWGLLYRRSLGDGLVYTFATLPESRFLSPPTHPLLLPMLVNLALPAPGQLAAINVEIGQALILSGRRYAAVAQVEIQDPANQRFRILPEISPEGRRFVFSGTEQPGLYWIRNAADNSVVALGNVQLPSAESDLIYRDAKTIVPPGDNVLVVRSFAELRASVARLNEPEPRWTWAIFGALLLICLEAMLASVSELWKPISFRSLLKK